MSDFKIVCGINPKEETIINLDKVCEITLDKECPEHTNCVRVGIADIGESWVFKTDIQELSDVLCCIEFAFNGRVDFTQGTVDFHKNRRKLL